MEIQMKNNKELFNEFLEWKEQKDSERLEKHPEVLYTAPNKHVIIVKSAMRTLSGGKAYRVCIYAKGMTAKSVSVTNEDDVDSACEQLKQRACFIDDFVNRLIRYSTASQMIRYISIKKQELIGSNLFKNGDSDEEV